MHSPTASTRCLIGTISCWQLFRQRTTHPGSGKRKPERRATPFPASLHRCRITRHSRSFARVLAMQGSQSQLSLHLIDTLPRGSHYSAAQGDYRGENEKIASSEDIRKPSANCDHHAGADVPAHRDPGVVWVWVEICYYVCQNCRRHE